MKIDKAIQLLGDLLHYIETENPPDDGDAVKLGIEALKRFKQWRFVKSHLASELLPGETRDK